MTEKVTAQDPSQPGSGPAAAPPFYETRYFCLDNGDRVMVPTNDMERRWDDEIFSSGGKPARVAKELKSIDDDPDFQPVSRTVATDDDWAELFAICCTTSVSAEIKDRFLKANKDFVGEIDPLVFVDSISKTYTRQDKQGSNTPSSSSENPFKDKSPHDCFLLLKQLVANTESIVTPQMFAIFDERSLQDDSILIIEVDEEDGVRSARCEFKIVSSKLLQYHIGDADMEEDAEEAEEEGDGVIRIDDEYIL